MRVLIQAEPFDAAALTQGFGAGAGAVVTFTGLVRADDGLTALEIEKLKVHLARLRRMQFGQSSERLSREI